MSAHVLLNLLNELGKRYKILLQNICHCKTTSKYFESHKSWCVCVIECLIIAILMPRTNIRPLLYFKISSLVVKL